MQRKHLESQAESLNVLIAGIPSTDLMSHIGKRYGKDLTIFVAETRPFEEIVAREAAAAKEAGFKVVLCTDNMIGSLMGEYEIDAVWSLYSKREGDIYTAINGARMSAILAREHGVPFLLFPHSSFPLVDKGLFAGKPITVAGAGYIDHKLDIVPAYLVAEAV